MNESISRDKVIAEIDRIPDHQLSELYALINNFKRDRTAFQASKQRIMQFAGSWADLSDEDFKAFLTEVCHRRQQAFRGRRTHETSPD